VSHKQKKLNPLVLFRSLLAPYSILALAAVSTPAYAQGGGGGGLTPLSITVNSGLDFGAIAADPSLAGTVTIDSAAGNKAVSNVTDLGGTHNRAELAISGDKNDEITISITDPSSVGSLTLSTMEHDCSAPCSIPGKGNFTLFIGGQVAVPGGTSAPSFPVSGRCTGITLRNLRSTRISPAHGWRPIRPVSIPISTRSPSASIWITRTMVA
jgi:hypothetical protein